MRLSNQVYPWSLKSSRQAIESMGFQAKGVGEYWIVSAETRTRRRSLLGPGEVLTDLTEWQSTGNATAGRRPPFNRWRNRATVTCSGMEANTRM